MLTQPQSEFLGFLRGLASTIVLLAHGVQIFLYRRIGYEHGLGLYTGNAATLAVMFFFVLSGFFITLSLIRNFSRHGRLHLGEFVCARLLRLYPPLLFSLVLCLVIYAVVHGFGLHGSVTYRFPEDFAPAAVAREKIELRATDLCAAATFSARVFWAEVPRMNGPLWSLMYEFWYYTLALCIGAAWFNRRWPWAAAGGAVLYLLVLAPDPLCFRLSGIWLLGALLAAAFAKGVVHQCRWLTRSALFIAVLHLTTSGQTLFDRDGAKYAWGVIFTALLVEILGRPSTACKLYPWLRRLNLGPSSYTLYVIHFPLMLLGLSLLGPWLRHRDLAVTGLTVTIWMGLIVWVATRCSPWLERSENMHRASPM